MNKINIGDTWKTYVLVSKHDSGLWFTMNIDPVKISKRHGENPDKSVEIWWFFRTETGDQELSRLTPCQTCYVYQRPGKIYNANQWINCPKCNPS